MSKDVTMRDIAKKMNLSAVSVSKAISGREGVSEELRAKILKTADEMGYVYSSLNAGPSGKNISVMVSEKFFSEDAFYARFFQCLSREFARHGHLCSLTIIRHEEEREGLLPKNIQATGIDGHIVLGPIGKKIIDALKNTGVPYIFVDNYTPEPNEDCVVSDNVYGTHVLTDYLIKKGYKKIAFVGSITATNSIMDRYLGYIKALLQNGMTVRSDYVLEDRDEEGFLLEVQMPYNVPDAFVCNSDETAYHLVEQLKTLGISVPEDVAVVGFDDYVFATLSRPALTTFRVNMEAMSKAAMDLMEQKIKEPGKTYGRRVISGEMVIRDSVR